MGKYDKERAELGINVSNGAISTSKYDEERKKLAQGIPKVKTAPVTPKVISKATPRLAPTMLARFGTPTTGISAEAKARNQAKVLSELNGKQGNLASAIRGVTLGMASAGLSNFMKDDKAQSEASKKNTWDLGTVPVITPSQARGLVPMNDKRAPVKGTYEGTANLIGSLVGVDPIGIGITKAVRFAIGKIAARSGVATHIIEAAMKNGDKGVTEAVHQEMKLLPAPKPNLNESKLIGENKVIAGNQVLDRKFVPTPKNSLMGDIAQKIGESPNANYAPGLYSKGIQNKIEGLSSQLTRLDKIPDAKYENFAKKNNLGNYVADFTEKPKLKEQPLIFKTQLNPNELSPRTLPQAPNLPPQPLKPNLGIKTPQEQLFAKNGLKTEQPIPKVEQGFSSRDNFNQEFTEKPDKEYAAFMEETKDYGEVKTGAEEFAQRITSKGVGRHKDTQRNADAAFRNSPEGRKWFKETFEDNLYKSKGEYANQTVKQLDYVYNDVVKGLDIKKASKESAGIQWLGDGKKQRRSGKNLSTETTPYGIDDLKADFNYKMPNGKMAWENIVQAESKVKGIYLGYVDKINGALRKIYPNVEVNVSKLQEKLTKVTDEESRKKVLQEIEDAIVGKRLMPRKDYLPHMRELQNKGFLVGLDNIINGATNIDPRLIGVSQFTKPNSKWTGFLQRRKDGEIYQEDAIGAILEYIPQAEYKVNIEPNIPVLRGVIKDIKESTINSRNANSFIDELMQVAGDLAGKTNTIDRIFPIILGDEKGRKVLNALTVVSGRMRANAVMGNINTVLAQPFNMANVVGYAKNPKDLAEGFAQSIKAYAGDKEAKALLDKSMYLKERYLDRSFRRFDKGVVSDIGKFFSWSMELGDKAVADGAWLTFYRQAMKKGMSEDKAILWADEFTRKATAGRGIAEMPLSQKAKVTKLIAPFQVEVRNAINVLGDLGAAKDIGGIAGIFITTFIMNEILYATTGRRIGIDPINIIRNAAVDIYEGEKTGGEIAKDTALGLVGNVVSNIPGGSYIADAAAGALGLSDYNMQKLFGQNDPSRFGTGNIAIQTLAAPIGQALKGQSIDLLKPLAATLPKFGGKQLERGIRGLQDMAVLPREKVSLKDGISLKKQSSPGSYSQSGNLRFPLENSLKNKITAPTLGTWSTREGKDYIKNAGKALGEKQTENFEKIAQGESRQAMFEFISKNRGLQKKGEVIEALRKSTLTDTQKRALLTQFYGYKL